MLSLVLTVALSAAPSLDDPDPERRVRAVEKWSRTHRKVKLPPQDDDKWPNCVRVSAPAELRCEKHVWLCVEGEGASKCSGSYWNSTFAQFVESPREPTGEQLDALRMRIDVYKDRPLLAHESGDSNWGDCTQFLGGAFVFDDGRLSEKELAQARARAARETQKLEAAWRKECEKEAKHQSEAEKVDVRCDVLLVNPCRRELFSRCHGRNADRAQQEAWIPVVGKVFRATWPESPIQQTPDGGSSQAANDANGP
jgi:hypothetical protein